MTPLVPNCSSPAVPLDPSVGWRGGTSCMGNSLSSISQCPGLYPSTPSTIHSQLHLEMTLQLHHLYGVDSTQEARDTSYKPSLNWHRVQHQGLLWMVGDIFVSHWTANCPPQAGQPPVSKVLSHHGLLSSLGAWRLGEHPTSRSSTTTPGNNKRKMSKKRPALKLGCWNVWTIMPSLSQDLQDISDARKTAVIKDELKRLNVNIADIGTLQETWLANAGTLKERDHTFFWQGKSSDEPTEHGVGFAVKNSLLSMVEPGSSGSKQLLNLCLNTTKGSVTLVGVYAPCLPLWMPRMNSMRTLHPPSRTSPVLSNLFSWVTSMPEWVQTMIHGPLALVLLEWGK